MQKPPYTHFTAGFHTVALRFSLNFWCECLHVFCRRFLKRSAQSARGHRAPTNPMATSHKLWSEFRRRLSKDSLSSAWTKCCTYLTPTTGLSGPQHSGCWTVPGAVTSPPAWPVTGSNASNVQSSRSHGWEGREGITWSSAHAHLWRFISAPQP